jgi:diguanylate cyclase (GGDEF)-like protein/PAS domain S-box-containing protein
MRRVPWPWLCVFAAVGVYGVLTAVHAGISYGWTAFADIGEVLAAGLAAVACTIRARSVHARYAARAADVTDPLTPGAGATRVPRRPAWSLLALGTGSWAVGQLCICVYEIGLGVRVPEPSIADGFFLLSYVLVIVGLLAFVRTPAGRLSQLRGAVEGMCIACGFLLCSWGLVLSSVIAHGGHIDLDGSLNAAYPMLDAVALGAVFFVALRRRRDPPTGLGLLALGILLWTVSDSAWWYITEVDSTPPTITPFETGWVAGFVLVAFAAWRAHQPHPLSKRAYDSRFALSLTALPGTIGVVIVTAKWAVLGHVESNDALALMGLFMMLALALLVIVTYENQALTNDLERRIQQRTAELRRTERYYRALVQHSSDLVMVLDADLRVRYVSDSSESVFGFRRDELAGRGLEVFGGEALETLSEALGRLSAVDSEVAPVAWRLTDASGRRRCAESTITNLLADSDVAGFVLNTRDETDRVALEEQMRDQAFHDPLTGLPNRALLGDRASQALVRSHRGASAVAVVVVDLDAFKLINDGFGHRVGDLLLRGVAERLSGAVRPQDTVARLGGDEFVVLMDPAPALPAETLALAERIQVALREELVLEGVAHRLTASIGVALGAMPHTDFDQLLCDADVALYCVKRAGRDGVQLFEASMNIDARERFALQTDLRKALDGDSLCLHYQPECNVETGQLDGFEALVRWNHPQRGLLAPGKFIPLAEETGLIVPLGRWVLEEALCQAMIWSREHPSAWRLTISVNVSAVQLKSPTIVADVESALGRSGIDPRLVVLEVTESSFIDNSAEIIDTLRALKALGVRLAIDDFGTGYTSIGGLQSMPVDILKIDKSFIDASNDGEHGQELLAAIVNIGRVLSLVTIAEGIERPEQLAIVRALGCNLAQGYLLGRPQPAEDAGHLIASHNPVRVRPQLSAWRGAAG